MDRTGGPARCPRRPLQSLTFYGAFPEIPKSCKIKQLRDREEYGLALSKAASDGWVHFSLFLLHIQLNLSK